MSKFFSLPGSLKRAAPYLDTLSASFRSEDVVAGMANTMFLGLLLIKDREEEQVAGLANLHSIGESNVM
jgi:hypothetical protein